MNKYADFFSIIGERRERGHLKYKLSAFFFSDSMGISIAVILEHNCVKHT